MKLMHGHWMGCTTTSAQKPPLQGGQAPLHQLCCSIQLYHSASLDIPWAAEDDLEHKNLDSQK